MRLLRGTEPNPVKQLKSVISNLNKKLFKIKHQIIYTKSFNVSSQKDINKTIKFLEIYTRIKGWYFYENT